MVLNYEHFGKFNRKTLEVLESGAGEGWRRSVGPIVCEMKKCCKGSRRKGKLTVKRRKANWIGHILRRHSLYNTLLKKG
jgi:hypothetical protein